MKRCPQCQQSFSDEYFFCLSDGTSLVSIFDAPEEATVVRTAPFNQPQAQPARQGVSPMFAYLAIGLLALIVGGAVVLWLKSNPSDSSIVKKETAKTDQSAKHDENASNSNQSNIENKPQTPTPNKTNIAISTPRLMPSINPNLNPSGRWTGDWTSNKAHYTAVLVLNDTGGGKFTGEIFWTLQRHTSPQKIYKAGATATEYVQGTFNPATRTLSLGGYRKDDPNDIVVLDKYNLTLAENNQNLGGGSKTNGRFNLSR